MKYALNLGADGRVLSATFSRYAPAGAVTLEALPRGDLADYRYAGGRLLYDPAAQPRETPLWQDRLEAQIAYTAMMTGTLLEE